MTQYWPEIMKMQTKKIEANSWEGKWQNAKTLIMVPIIGRHFCIMFWLVVQVTSLYSCYYLNTPYSLGCSMNFWVRRKITIIIKYIAKTVGFYAPLDAWKSCCISATFPMLCWLLPLIIAFLLQVSPTHIKPSQFSFHKYQSSNLTG